MTDKKIHPTHFQVPELPWKEKEKQAILLFQEILYLWGNNKIKTREYINVVAELLQNNKDLVDWIMKYNE